MEDLAEQTKEEEENNGNHRIIFDRGRSFHGCVCSVSLQRIGDEEMYMDKGWHCRTLFWYISGGDAALGIIGLNMIKESREDGEECGMEEDSLKVKEMLVLAVATSIDALAVGITFAFLQVDIIPAVAFIGVTTFLLSVGGVKMGNVFGAKYKSKAELAGGLILILMGIKILLEHLGIF